MASWTGRRRITQSLQDHYLPIANVDWVHEKAGLAVTSFVQGTPERAQLIGRYRLSNPDRSPTSTPWQAVQSGRGRSTRPPSSSTPSVASAARDALDVGEQLVRVNGEPRIYPLQVPDARLPARSMASSMRCIWKAASTRPRLQQTALVWRRVRDDG
jgi:hypothetical protein